MTAMTFNVSQLLCRPATAQDLAVIADFPQNAEELFYAYPKASFPLTAEQLADAIAQRSDATVLEYAGEVVAFANFYQWQHGVCAIGNVLVSPRRRGLGIARQLVSEMERIAQTRHQAREIHISCFNQNTLGFLLYSSLGYTVCGSEIRQAHDGQRHVLIHLRKTCPPRLKTADCQIIGILDDGWAGLGDAARAALAGADLVIGAGRTLALIKPHLPQTALRDMDGALTQSPAWIEAARAEGKNVVVLATGDPLCHGIASYLLSKLGRDGVDILPAPSTLQIAFARWQQPWQDVTIASCHSKDAGEWVMGATPDHGLYPLMRAIALNRRVFAFTSPENNPARLARALISAGYGDEVKLSVAARLLLPDESIHHALSAADAAAMLFAAPSVVLIERSDSRNSPAFGREDLEYIQRSPEKGLITKQEARALSLAKLCLKPDAIVWDIGAGSGSVGLEAATLAPLGHVWAIEKNAGDAANARANATQLRIGNYTLCEDKAPALLDTWPDPDAVFIGGSGGELDELIHLILSRLKPAGRLVMNFVTLENLATATTTLKALGADWDVVQLQASRSQPILDMHRLAAQNPVWIVTAYKETA